jgi:hypothetical protein
MILLCNHKRMVYEKPYAYLEPMSALENFQWCGEPYFAVSAISIGDILPQIPISLVPLISFITSQHGHYRKHPLLLLV